MNERAETFGPGDTIDVMLRVLDRDGGRMTVVVPPRECVWGSEDAHPGGSDYCLTHGKDRGEHETESERRVEVSALIHAPHPDVPHRFRIECDGCGGSGRLSVSLHGDDEIVVTVKPNEQRLAEALLEWYDTTHGNTIGEHDHHCPAARRDDNSKGCTCGWQAVADADRMRTEART